MKLIKAKASGSTINRDCLTGSCEAHRLDLLIANTEFYAEIQIWKQRFYMSSIGLSIVIALVLYFRNWI